VIHGKPGTAAVITKNLVTGCGPVINKVRLACHLSVEYQVQCVVLGPLQLRCFQSFKTRSKILLEKKSLFNNLLNAEQNTQNPETQKWNLCVTVKAVIENTAISHHVSAMSALNGKESRCSCPLLEGVFLGAVTLLALGCVF